MPLLVMPNRIIDFAQRARQAIPFFPVPLHLLLQVLAARNNGLDVDAPGRFQSELSRPLQPDRRGLRRYLFLLFPELISRHDDRFQLQEQIGGSRSGNSGYAWWPVISHSFVTPAVSEE